MREISYVLYTNDSKIVRSRNAQCNAGCIPLDDMEIGFAVEWKQKTTSS